MRLDSLRIQPTFIRFRYVPELGPAVHKPAIMHDTYSGTNDKDREEPNNRQGAVYKIKCSDCQA